MSNDPKDQIPQELSKRLNQETSDDYEELSHVWALLGEGSPYSGTEKDASMTWSQLEPHLWNTGRTDRSPEDRLAPDRPAHRPRRIPRTASTLLVAAVIVISIALGSFLWWQQPVEVTAPPGEMITVLLPDESSVELGGGSSISYPRGFSALPLFPADQREVQIEGEAFFDVANEERPFLVETFNAQVEVMGTKFDVQAWSDMDEPETRVTLASGAIQVASKSRPEQAVILQEAGHASSIVGMNSAPTSPGQANLDQVTAWRQQGFYASSQPLSSIAQRLEHRFGVEIALRVDDISSEPLTLFYPQQIDLETILYDICVAKDLKYRETSQGYEIFSDARTTDD